MYFYGREGGGGVLVYPTPNLKGGLAVGQALLSVDTCTCSSQPRVKAAYLPHFFFNF